MKLTAEERAMLEAGGIVSRMMRLLVRLGEIYGAERMVPVASAQVSGVSYKSLGDPGVEFLEDVAAQGARVSVPTTLNPAGMDLEGWREMGVPEDFAREQERIMAALRAMGVHSSPTCTPYLAGSVPGPGEHLAWAESSAVSYANSVLGARTNREGGPSALAAAVCGRTPAHGLHLDESRRPTHIVEVEARIEKRSDYGALGYVVGRRVGAGVPWLRGIPEASGDDLKALGAAMAASGAVALYHAEGTTPEAHGRAPGDVETVRVSRGDIEEVYSSLTTSVEPDLVVLGCPHASLGEIADLAGKIEGRRLRRPLWICTCRATKIEAAAAGLERTIEDAGGRVVADTCMVVAPLERMGVSVTAVDSAKAAHYLPALCGQKVLLGDVDALVEAALS